MLHYRLRLDTMPAMAVGVTSSSSNPFGLLVLAVICILWVLPTIIAVRRDVPDKWLPILLSLLFGGLIIPWLIGLWLACRRYQPRMH